MPKGATLGDDVVMTDVVGADVVGAVAGGRRDRSVCGWLGATGEPQKVGVAVPLWHGRGGGNWRGGM